MNERDDYLWDRSGAGDPTTRQLEQVLGALAHDGRELPLPQLPSQRARRARPRWPWLAVAAAAAAAIVWALSRPDAVLQPGAPPRTFVAGAAPLAVPLGKLAEITLEPGASLRFEHWRPDQALFRLERGTMLARVAPPPAVAPDFFLVDTKLGRVTDKGCRYELRVGDDGSNHIRVTEGAVTFAFAGRTVFVPAGASTLVTAAGGPSTPLFVDATAALRKAVGEFDAVAATGEPDLRRKLAAILSKVCREPRDSLVLFHLLDDADAGIRAQAEAALVELVGPPVPEPGKLPHWERDVWLAFLRVGPWVQAR